MVLRIVVVVVAACVLGWLGIMERNVRVQARGVAAAQQPDRPGNAARAEADLRRARFLDPDTAPDLRRAFLYRATGRPEQATALLEDVLRREPENLTAWGVLFTFTRDDDPAAARALAARRRLDPVGARRR